MLLVVLAVAIVACDGTRNASAPGSNSDVENGETPVLPRGTLLIATDKGPVQVDVEIAETPRASAKGLMGRTSLAENAGMVFLEPEPLRVGFWMKNTLIPLSIAFWDDRSEILAILDMEPCESDPCPTYDPEVAWTGAVEVNQGFFERHDVQVGDGIRLERKPG